jgi:hypothetical protein
MRTPLQDTLQSLVENHEEKETLERPRRLWEDIINTDPKEIWWKTLSLSHPAHNWRCRRRTSTNRVVISLLLCSFQYLTDVDDRLEGTKNKAIDANHFTDTCHR